MGSERPENCPVDSFQWRTGEAPGEAGRRVPNEAGTGTCCRLCRKQAGEGPMSKEACQAAVKASDHCELWQYGKRMRCRTTMPNCGECGLQSEPDEVQKPSPLRGGATRPQCGKQRGGKIVPATVVDHIIPHRGGPAIVLGSDELGKSLQGMPR